MEAALKAQKEKLEASKSEQDQLRAAREKELEAQQQLEQQLRKAELARQAE